MQYVKDLFIFSSYTGLAYIDVMKLTPDDIQLGIDKQIWIFMRREKTDNPVRIPLLPTAIEIVNKHKDDIKAIANNKTFPPITNQRLNSYLKEISDLCGIKKNLTFHVARHTFATFVNHSCNQHAISQLIELKIKNGNR